MRHIWAAKKQMGSKTNTHLIHTHTHTHNTHIYTRTHTCTNFANTFLPACWLIGLTTLLAHWQRKSIVVFVFVFHCCFFFSRKNRESKTNWWKLFACSLFFGHFVARFICAFLFAERFCSLLSHGPGFPYSLCCCCCCCRCALLAMLQKRSLNLLCVVRSPCVPDSAWNSFHFVSFRFSSVIIWRVNAG